MDLLFYVLPLIWPRLLLIVILIILCFPIGIVLGGSGDDYDIL